MRPKVVVLGAAVVLAGTAVGAYAYVRTRPETIKQPTLRYEQTADAVKVYIRNANKTWGMRNQRVVITLVGEQQNILRSYGPDEDHTYEGAPGKTLACCLIDELPPRGEFVFTLWPLPRKLAGVTIDPDPTPRWVRWKS